MAVGPNYAFSAAGVEIYLEWNSSYSGKFLQCARGAEDTWVYLGPLEITISKIRETTDVEDSEARDPSPGGVSQD